MVYEYAISSQPLLINYLVRPLSDLRLVSGLFDWRESHGFESYHEVNTAYVMRQTIEFIIIVMHVDAFKM